MMDPLPDVLVMADMTADAYQYVHAGCTAVNPGSLAHDGSFAILHGDGSVELSLCTEEVGEF